MYPQKWRPSLALIVIGMLAIVLSLPLAALLVFRFYDGQLVRETESELIAQGSVLTTIVAHTLQRATVPDALFGRDVPEDIALSAHNRCSPFLPQIDLFTGVIKPSRPVARAPHQIPHQTYQTLGRALQGVLMDTQRRTLAGFRILDPNGVVIAGGGEIGASLAHVEEVATALAGRHQSVVRERSSSNPRPTLESISRSAQIRVFVALPVIVNNRVAGIVYLSRTPNNVVRVLYDQRGKLALLAGFVLVATAAIAAIFIRTVKGPITELTRRTNAIRLGNRDAIRPLHRHGSQEFATLSENVLAMSERLFERADYIQTFAAHVSHELKSPLTSIHGAAELLRDNAVAMSDEEREKFLSNIVADTARLSQLLERLRDLALADNPVSHGTTTLGDVLEETRPLFPDLAIDLDGQATFSLPLTQENAMIVFGNLLDNAGKHGADRVMIGSRFSNNTLVIDIADNGKGISQANRDRIFDLFFTTEREEGGTGMGLAIVRSLLRAHKGDIDLAESAKGARFEINLPRR